MDPATSAANKDVLSLAEYPSKEEDASVSIAVVTFADGDGHHKNLRQRGRVGRSGNLPDGNGHLLCR